MKLPDFTQFEPLNELREKMGAELRDYGLPNPHRLTTQEIKELGKSGIEIPLDKVRVLDDGTLAYKNRRVILYIRDINSYQNRPIEEDNLPRFHISNCSTLEYMRSQQRDSRYVVSTREDGKFAIYIIRNNKPKPLSENLKVCRNCLDKLSWQGYESSSSKKEKEGVVNGFHLQDFFAEYSKSPITNMPPHTSDTAPINIYTDGFGEVARQRKIECGFKCEKCERDCSDPTRRKFLHAHHINGQKNDNSPDNIRILCLGCHVEEPMHGHMKGLPDYQEFIRIFGASQ